MTVLTRSLRPYVRNAFHVRTQYGEVDITTPVSKEKICVSSTTPGMRRQHALRWAGSGSKVGVQRQLVDGGLISARRQVGLMDLVLSNARKWHGTTLRVQMVSSQSVKNEKNKQTYAVRQTNNGIHCAVSLKEVVAVWIVVLAHEMDILRCCTRVATRGNLPTSGKSDVRNCTDRSPLCVWCQRRYEKGTCLV